MKRIILTLIFLPNIITAQTHSIDQHNLLMFGNTDDNDISINTYYNTLDSCNVSWNIIKDSLPSQWNFSICFPDCYITNLTHAQNSFSANEAIYLNCHMSPNNQAGTGILQMEITTNNLYKDTVTWTGSVSSIAAINNPNALNSKNRKLIKVVDILGKETIYKGNQPLIYIYDDGTVEKRIIIID